MSTSFTSVTKEATESGRQKTLNKPTNQINMARVSVFQFWFNSQTITWTFVKLTVIRLIRLTLFCVPNMFSRELILLLVFIKKYTYISPKLKLLLTTVFSPVLHLIDKSLDTFFYSLHRFFSHNDHLLDQEI